MSEELHAFFAMVTEDQALQERLYITKELSDVAAIAREMGFNLTGTDILRAQAGRVLSLPTEEQEILAAGGKSQFGAQWGRHGKGYLDNTGFWVFEFVKWGYTSDSDPNIAAFLAKVNKDKGLESKLLKAKTHNAVAAVAHENGFEFSGAALLRHQAEHILKLDNKNAERVASGA